MQALKFGLIVAVALGLGACAREDSARRDEPPAKQVGKAAYNLKKDLKKEAREAADELRKAGKEMR
jgi:hypothetical protein